MGMSERVARMLLGCVEALAARPEECARSPGRDISRRRKLGLARLLLLLVCWGRDSARAECIRSYYSAHPTWRCVLGVTEAACVAGLAHVHAGRGRWGFTCPRSCVLGRKSPSWRAAAIARFGARELLVRDKSSRAPEIA